MILGPLSHEQRHWQIKILVATYIGYAGYYLTRKVFTIAKSTFVNELGWSYEQTSYVWMTFLITYMLGQFISSFVGRKYGSRFLLLVGLMITILCNVAFGISNSFATFMVFMAINGFAQASGWPGVVGGVSRWLHPDERGSIFGIWATSYQIGNILVKMIGATLLATAGMSWAFFGCSAATLFIWALLLVWHREKPEDVGLEPIVPDEGDDYQAVDEAQRDQVSLREYLSLAFHPVVLIMGTSYFCLKFLRYALDSWLPAFLNEQGMSVAVAGWASSIFDYAGLAGAVAAGFALDRIFKGNWAALCLCAAFGIVGGYLAVVYLGTSPMLLALCFGLVGFMLYGPDMILSGAAAVEVAGSRNGVAVAGIINGIGSFGPVVQELVIGRLMSGDVDAGIRNANLLALSMSMVFTVMMMIMVVWLHLAKKRHEAAHINDVSSKQDET